MSQSQRTAYFDNAKFLLMILVVFSHYSLYRRSEVLS